MTETGRRVSHLYVMQSTSGLIKIGRSAEPKERLRALQTASGHKIALLLVLSDRGDEEAVIHAKLAAHRGIGEWFADTHESRRDICIALARVIKFRYSDASPGRLARLTREASVPAVRQREYVRAEVERVAARMIRQASFPREWDEAHDAEEEMMDGHCPVAEVNAIRERVGLPPLAE